MSDQHDRTKSFWWRVAGLAARRFLLAALVLLAILAALAGTGQVEVPYRYNPFATLDLAAEPDWFTGYRLGRLSRSDAVCEASLRAAGIALRRGVPEARWPRSPNDECDLSGAIQLPAPASRLTSDVTATCPLAVRWLMFERHALQPVARRHFGVGAARSTHRGTYSCRRIAGSSRWSEHARANAIDISEFVLADGRRVSLLRDWNAADARRAFLRDVRDGACRFFRGVLSPDYNAAHADHFHFDDGRFSVCR